MSLSLAKTLNYSAGKVTIASKADNILHNLVHSAVDSVAPGLGKKEKLVVVANVKKIIKKLGTYTKKAVVKTAKNVIGDPNSFLVFNKGLHSMTSGRRMVLNDSTNSSGVSSGGRMGLGGVSYAPVAISRNIRRSSKPRMSMNGNSTVIAHSEMLGAVLSGTPTANVTAYRCFGLRANPGLTSIFPWLSTMAVNYEKYRFRRLRFTLVPLVATSFSGRIGVGFDYDSSDLAPGNRQEFYALTNHAENMPWEACAIEVKCDNTLRFTGTHVAADNKLIDQGQVILMSDAISGGTISAAIPLYDLIVDYEVELVEPQQSLFSTQLFSNSTLTNGNVLGVGTDTTTVAGPTVMTSITVTSNTVLTYAFPAGNYAFTLLGIWSSGAAVVTVATASTGAVVRSNVSSGTSFASVVGTLTATSDAVVTFTSSGVGWATNLTKFDSIIARVTSSVATSFI